MKLSKLNKGIIFFLVLVILLIAGAWNFIQTRAFSQWIANQTKQQIYEKAGIEISFQTISIDFFPLATRFNDVVIKKNIEEKKFSVAMELGEFSVVLSVFDLLSSDVSIKRVVLKDGTLAIDYPGIDELFISKGDSKISDFKLGEVFASFQNAVDGKIPLDLQGISLEQVQLKLNHDSVWIENTLLEYSDELTLQGVFEDINFQNKKLDNLRVDLNWAGTSLIINKLEAIEQFERVEIAGEINDEKNGPWLNLKSIYNGGGRYLFDYLAKYHPDLKTIDAFWNVSADINGQIDNPDVKGRIVADDLKSEFVGGNHLEIAIKKEGDAISLENLLLNQGTGQLKISQPILLYKAGVVEILKANFTAELSRFHTNDALYYIRDSISPLKGEVTGVVNVKFDQDGQHFTLAAGSYLEHFKLNFNPKDTDILVNERLVFNKAEFHLANDMSLFMDLDFSFGDSRIEGSGTIRSDYISINANSDKFSFKNFGPISGVPIEGDGPVRFQVDGPLNDVRFYFDVDLENTRVVDLDLGHSKGNLRLDLKDLQLYLNQIDGRKGNSNYQAQGKIRFEDDQQYLIDVHFPHGTYRDILSMYRTYLPNDFMPKGLAFTYQGDYVVRGSLKQALPTISGTLQARNLTWFNESADRLNMSFLFKDGIIRVNDLSLRKRAAALSGRLLYDLNTEYLEYNARLNGLRLHDIAMYRIFNFGYDGLLEGNFKGDGKVSELITQTKLKIAKGNIFNQAIQDSTLVIYSDAKNFFLNGSILGSILTFDSYLNLDFANQMKMSYINAAINTSNVKILTGFISDHNSLDNSISGRISANLESSFNFVSAKSLNLLFEINEFAFKRDNIRLVLNPVKRNILIKNGEIRHWDVLLKGKNGVIQSVGNGQFYQNYNIDSKINIDASVFEMVFPRLQKAAGPLALDWSLASSNGNSPLSVLRGEGSGVLLKITGVPDTFEDLAFLFQLAGPKLTLQQFKSKFGHGTIGLAGTIDLKIPYPVIDLNVDIDQTRLNFFKNSSVVVSAVGRLHGNQPPYDVRSDASILYGELLDEFSEYQIQSSESVDNMYIPKPIDVGYINFFNYDVGVRTLSPLLIRNQMADIQVMGQVHVGGNYHLPNVQGDLSVIQGKSRFQFKGHDFSLTEGKVSLGQDILDQTPSIKLTAVSKVQNYDVKVDVSGKVNNFDLKLTSEPALSQQDILSLLTLGITSDIANNLDDTGRKSITSLSLGSLIVDQFVLNRGINSSSGIKLSVLPEFGESDESLLHGRMGGSSSSTKMKSATKVKLQTKISKKVDLSFSSTVGGTMNQKQEMHVDYSLGNNMTVKGIYEVEASENGDAQSGSSLGIDFNYRKTFK